MAIGWQPIQSSVSASYYPTLSSSFRPPSSSCLSRSFLVLATDYSGQILATEDSATSAMDMTPGLESDTHTPSHAMSIPYPHSGSSQTPQAQELTIQQQAQSQASGQPKFSNGPHIRSRITVVCAEVSTLSLHFLGNPPSLERHVQPTRLLLLFISQNNRNNRQWVCWRWSRLHI